LGCIAKNCFENIPNQFSFAFLDEFVIMPNHVHAIIILQQSNNLTSTLPCRDAIHRVSGIEDSVTKISGGCTKDNNPMLQKNLARVIRWYKGRTSFEMRRMDKSFSWQPRYHEHIIRNQKSLDDLRHYIWTNPYKWQDDCYFEG